ncbi:MAG: hypothetical protein WCH62_09060, partial [Candidatus Omnitrophota bacterium]
MTKRFPLVDKSIVKKCFYIIIEFIIFIFFVGFYARHSLLLPDSSRLYSTSIAHRLQTNAFLQGKLFLSQYPFGFLHDFIWTEHGMSQNWGLGVPLLKLPFEWLSNQCGFGHFPDRLTLLFYFSLMIIILNTSLRLVLGAFGVVANSVIGVFVRWYFIAFILFTPAFMGLIQRRF